MTGGKSGLEKLIEDLWCVQCRCQSLQTWNETNETYDCVVIQHTPECIARQIRMRL